VVTGKVCAVTPLTFGLLLFYSNLYALYFGTFVQRFRGLMHLTKTRSPLLTSVPDPLVLLTLLYLLLLDQLGFLPFPNTRIALVGSYAYIPGSVTSTGRFNAQEHRCR
jgi:hypothetical protein